MEGLLCDYLHGVLVVCSESVMVLCRVILPIWFSRVEKCLFQTQKLLLLYRESWNTLDCVTVDGKSFHVTFHHRVK